MHQDQQQLPDGAIGPMQPLRRLHGDAIDHVGRRDALREDGADHLALALQDQLALRIVGDAPFDLGFGVPEPGRLARFIERDQGRHIVKPRGPNPDLAREQMA